MRKIIFLIALLIFSSYLKAQNYALQDNAKTRNCYKRNFNYNKKFKRKESKCSEIVSKVKIDSITEQRNIVNFKKYQDKLKKLGFNIEVNGVLDNKTINAHNIYLKYLSKMKTKKKCYFFFNNNNNNNNNNNKENSLHRIDCELLKACKIKNKIKIIQLELKKFVVCAPRHALTSVTLSKTRHLQNINFCK